MNAQQKPIVAILFRRVGDSLLATPALRAVKKARPDGSLFVIAEPQVERVFKYNPWIDEILLSPVSPSPIALAALMRTRGRPAIALDFLSDPRSALASVLSGARLRFGFAYGLRSKLYHLAAPLQNPSSPVYSARHKLQLAELAEAHEDSLETEFYLTDENHSYAEMRIKSLPDISSKQIVCISPFSRREYKRWPVEAYVILCKILHDSTAVIPVLVSGPKERGYCEEIRRLAGLPEGRLQQFDDLGDMAAFMQRCSMFVGNDGGPKHLAVAMGIRTVTIFRNDPPEYWTPPDGTRHLALAATDAQSEVTVDDVLTAIKTFGASI